MMVMARDEEKKFIFQRHFVTQPYVWNVHEKMALDVPTLMGLPY